MSWHSYEIKLNQLAFAINPDLKLVSHSPRVHPTTSNSDVSGTLNAVLASIDRTDQGQTPYRIDREFFVLFNIGSSNMLLYISYS